MDDYRNGKVHKTICPRTIMTGQWIKYDKHCKVEQKTQPLNLTKNVWSNSSKAIKKQTGWTLFSKSTYKEKSTQELMDRITQVKLQS